MAIGFGSRRTISASTLKRLVLCLDGTWNSADDEDPLTNVVQLRDLVDPKYVNDRTGGIEEQRTYYDQGVGTGMFDRFRGGIFGHGLAENVQQAYRFLSQFYEPDVEIYIFGFSRGAFTARSLAGYIGAAGLLKAELCMPEMEARCWAYYRTTPKDRYPSEKAELSKHTHRDLRITCLGVFDTVGALGVPVDALSAFNRRKYEFHDTALSSIVDHAFHALAVDEKRGPFEAAVWAKPPHKNNQSIEQVWFPGVHSNIGGGYPDGALSNLTLKWMIDRMRLRGLGLVLDGAAAAIAGDPCGELYESRSALYAYSKFKPRIRVINQTGRDELSGNRLSGLTRNARPIGEMLHWSVLKRWTESRVQGSKIAKYEPPNVAAVLKSIYDNSKGPRLPVVGPSSDVLEWCNNSADFDFLLGIMPEEHRAGLQAVRNSGC